MARKPQTEKKAKGLISGVGDYKGRTLNLTKKQLAQSGTKGARAASKGAYANISDTSFVKGKGVMKGGKLFTGKVDLGGGNIAVYVGGKRVRAGAPSSNGKGRGGGGGGGAKNPPVTTTRVSPSARGEGAGRTRPTDGSEGPKRSVPRRNPQVSSRPGGGRGYGLGAAGVGSLSGRSNTQSERIARRLRGGRAAR